MEVILEMGADPSVRSQFGVAFERKNGNRAHISKLLPGLAGYAEDEADEEHLLTRILR